MNSNARIFCFLALTVAALSGCSSGPAAKESKKAAAALDKIQGKAQVMEGSNGAADAALNAGGPSLYLWEGTKRYRLFLRTAVELLHGERYIAEGIYAQKTIDEIGDPDQGKNGYPLQSSCEEVVRKVWHGLAMDEIEADATTLRTIVQRYPARPVFLVSRIQLVKSKEGGAASAESESDAAAEGKNIPEVSVAGDKQQASLIEGPTVQAAPLWQPAGGTVHCKVVINQEGKISDLETGMQLCESVPWSQFRYQPLVRGGHPVKVRTEVEVRFEPRK
jgi:hypothetical protein